jgi:hypothetical protein
MKHINNKEALNIKLERDILEHIAQDDILASEFVKMPKKSQQKFIKLLIKYGHRYI